MENNHPVKHNEQQANPQLRLRTGLRGGASVDACTKSLEDWQKNYYKHYNTVNASKSTPCNNL